MYSALAFTAIAFLFQGAQNVPGSTLADMLI